MLDFGSAHLLRAFLLLPLMLAAGSRLPAAETPPGLRLPAGARPVRYALDLRIDPAQDTFHGFIDIDLVLEEAASRLWLNSSDLTIDSATLWKEEVELPGTAELVEKDFAAIRFAQAAAPGAARLHLEYEGVLSKTDTAGIFKQKDGDDWYAFSQFEATSARRAFPCFDEPAYKVPWQVTVHVPKGNLAVSNTPVAAESADPDGWRSFRFKETPPLPSYLIALGVGPFDIVDAGEAGKRHTPLRIISLKGKGPRARYAAEVTGQIVARLEDYFGIPYPYEKLDSLVIPQTVNFGAMENAGLITYVEPLILARPEDETVGWMRGYASVAAHEIAHQWFGDLVTMAWWNDLWLNESFATWMSTKILIGWKPEWRQDVNRVASRSRAMGDDEIVTARFIRQPITSKDDIENAFDGITYGKGAAVLRMFESWLGEKQFQAGVRRYLAAHTQGNATAEDFLGALETEGGPGVAQAFATFLDQAGAPVVSAELRCVDHGPARLAVSQKRFLPTGSRGSEAQLWQIPMCIRWSTGGKEERLCKVVAAETAEIELPVSAGCPDWVLANDGEAGYYRTLYRGALLQQLLQDEGKALTLPERVGVLRDVSALAAGGAVPLGEALALVPRFGNDPNREIVSAMAGVAGSPREHLVPPALRTNYARFIEQVFGEKARALGYIAKPEEDDDTRLLRQAVVGLVADEGADPNLRAAADRLARQWLGDRAAVPADMASTVLEVAAAQGGEELFDLYHAEARRATERHERDQILSAMGSFRDPAIERRALALFLTDEFDPREATSLVFSGLREETTRPLVYDFVKQNFDAMVAKLPRDSGAYLSYAGASFCDEAHRADVEAYFKDRAPKYTGGPRILAQVLEGISLCEAAKAAQEPQVAAFLKSY
jgi:alanyl aminopeptidase